jgi:aspartyl-tRNA(Asn)/glutamyl-tRNA(Gln) amidotransferase subunit C
MSLSRDDIKRLADLARLDLPADQAEKLRGELDRILGYVDRLQKIKTDGVAETSTVPQESLRSDVAFPVDEEERELILSDFPARVGDALQTPAVFEKPKV